MIDFPQSPQVFFVTAESGIDPSGKAVVFLFNPSAPAAPAVRSVIVARPACKGVGFQCHPAALLALAAVLAVGVGSPSDVVVIVRQHPVAAAASLSVLLYSVICPTAHLVGLYFRFVTTGTLACDSVTGASQVYTIGTNVVMIDIKAIEFVIYAHIGTFRTIIAVFTGDKLGRVFKQAAATQL